jgi:hypothetical protein
MTSWIRRLKPDGKYFNLIFLEFSKAVRFLISKPFLAETDIDIATTKGTANPRACGQVKTITPAMRSNAKTNGLLPVYQTGRSDKKI